MRRCTLVFLLFLSGCRQDHKTEVQRSFYYWKTVLRLSPREAATLDSLSVRKLYVKFFDVAWDAARQSALPIATLQPKGPLPAGLRIAPVVFITNEAIALTSANAIDSLARKIAALTGRLASIHQLPLDSEIQFDCDWTAGTREKYFRLLAALRRQPFIAPRTVSATIRLHQLKYRNQAGIPPVDKGLLMCYNMGNLHNALVKNSILDVDELKKYTGRLRDYPLSLDVALPLFDWYVWFRGGRFKGLIRPDALGGRFTGPEKTVFRTRTPVNGYVFEAGDWLRFESSEGPAIKKAAAVIGSRLSAQKIGVVLYHLDEYNLAKYTAHEMEDFYNGFQ